MKIDRDQGGDFLYKLWAVLCLFRAHFWFPPEAVSSWFINNLPESSFYFIALQIRLLLASNWWQKTFADKFQTEKSWSARHLKVEKEDSELLASFQHRKCHNPVRARLYNSMNGMVFKAAWSRRTEKGRTISSSERKLMYTWPISHQA